MQRSLDVAKWKLWHGKPDDALDRLEDVLQLGYNFEDSYAGFAKFEGQVQEFITYVGRNAAHVANYGREWRAGRTISTAFVESMVNALLSRRFAKKQQMQWTPRGAHLLLQVRVQVANKELRDSFRRWYPSMDGRPASFGQRAAAVPA